jgi:trimeric autotransporter adhesin
MEGAIYFGNSGHGVKRAYSGINDVGLYTTAADVYLSANGTATSEFVLKNNGNVGIGTSTPARKLTVNAAGYGIEHTDGSVRLGTYVQGDSGWFGTISPHPLLFFVNDSGFAMRIGTNNNTTFTGEITTTAVNITSDRNAKEQFKPVNARDVLAKVVGLPISEWQYKTQSDARHIGPMAQDFHAAFAVGRDDKHITSVDADGVALAAIQGLNEKFDEQTREKDTRIQELEKTVAELKELVSKLAAQKGGAR